MRGVLAFIGAAIMCLILLVLAGTMIFAVVVMPFFGVYEPALGAGIVAVIFFAAWGFVEVVNR